MIRLALYHFEFQTNQYMNGKYSSTSL